MDETQAELIAEQLTHAIDLLRADMANNATQQQHDTRMADHRLNKLEQCEKDHETRIRQIQDGVTQFRVLARLATGGGLLSLIALLRLILE